MSGPARESPPASRSGPGPAEAPEEASPDGSEEEGPSYGGMAMQ